MVAERIVGLKEMEKLSNFLSIISYLVRISLDRERERESERVRE